MPRPPEPPVPKETRLTDGTPAVIRPVTPEDAPLLVEGFEHLSDESRYRRFLEAIKHLTPKQVEYLTNADGRRHIAWGMTVVDPKTGKPIGVGVARCVRDGADENVAEFAVAVADEWQRKGVARQLARVVADAAWRAGIRRFKGLMLSDNVGAYTVMDELGELRERHYDGPGVLEAIWDLYPPEDATSPEP